MEINLLSEISNSLLNHTEHRKMYNTLLVKKIKIECLMDETAINDVVFQNPDTMHGNLICRIC